LVRVIVVYNLYLDESDSHVLIILIDPF